MRWLWKLFLLLTFILILIASILAVLDNSETVSLRFLSWQTPDFSIYWWLLSALAIGFLLGALSVTFGSVRLKLKERHLQKQLKDSEKQASQLRNQSLVD